MKKNLHFWKKVTCLMGSNPISRKIKKMSFFLATIFIKFLIPHTGALVCAIELSLHGYGFGLHGLAQFFVHCASYSLDNAVINSIANFTNISDSVGTESPKKISFLYDAAIHPYVERALAKEANHLAIINSKLEAIRQLPSVKKDISLLLPSLVDGFFVDYLTRCQLWEIQLTYVPNKNSVRLSLETACDFISDFIVFDKGNDFDTLVRIPLDVDIEIADLRTLARRFLDHETDVKPDIIRVANKLANIGSVNLNKVGAAKSSGLLNSYVNYKHI